jgi:hypothetical protein
MAVVDAKYTCKQPMHWIPRQLGILSADTTAEQRHGCKSSDGEVLSNQEDTQITTR